MIFSIFFNLKVRSYWTKLIADSNSMHHISKGDGKSNRKYSTVRPNTFLGYGKGFYLYDLQVPERKGWFVGRNSIQLNYFFLKERKYRTLTKATNGALFIDFFFIKVLFILEVKFDTQFFQFF
jgi:hypothetical protein